MALFLTLPGTCLVFLLEIKDIDDIDVDDLNPFLFDNGTILVIGISGGASLPDNHCSAHSRGILQTRSSATSRGFTFKAGKH